jgi:hypothetical protein
MNAKRRLFVLVSVYVVFVLTVSGCTPSSEATSATVPETSTNIYATNPDTATREPLTPTVASTATPTSTVTATATPTPTITATPEPVLYCADKIPGCYFLGNEIARIFARMTVTCFENGGECYPPVEDCTVLPSKVVHVPVENFATAWESEVNGNPAYKDLLNSKLYDNTKQYCFVDEGIAQLVRDAGNVEYTANKACLDNEKVPCDVILRFGKFDYVACGEDCQGLLPGAYLTENNFGVIAAWVAEPLPEIDLENVMTGELTANMSFSFAYVFVSSATGFSDNANPPADIYIAER